MLDFCSSSPTYPWKSITTATGSFGSYAGETVIRSRLSNKFNCKIKREHVAWLTVQQVGAVDAADVDGLGHARAASIWAVVHRAATSSGAHSERRRRRGRSTLQLAGHSAVNVRQRRRSLSSHGICQQRPRSNHWRNGGLRRGVTMRLQLSRKIDPCLALF